MGRRSVIPTRSSVQRCPSLLTFRDFVAFPLANSHPPTSSQATLLPRLAWVHRFTDITASTRCRSNSALPSIQSLFGFHSLPFAPNTHHGRNFPLQGQRISFNSPCKVLTQSRATVRRISRPTKFKTRAGGSAVRSCSAVAISILECQAEEDNARAEQQRTEPKRDRARFRRSKASPGQFCRAAI
jgi:hypothetical protein